MFKPNAKAIAGQSAQNDGVIATTWDAALAVMPIGV
jgi:hypothetical protein